MIPEVWTVRGVKRETRDTFTFRLAPPAGAAGSAAGFRPGQFNMLYAPGAGEAAISICGDPQENGERAHTVRVVGRVTQALARLGKGDSLGLRGPFGRPWPMEEAEGGDVLIVAGGIGLAPLRPAVLHILAHRKRYGEVHLLYGARTPEEMLYPADLQRWKSRFDMAVTVTVDRGDPGWQGNVGVVTSLIRRRRFDPDKVTAMVCGPEIMMRFALLELQRQEIPDDRIYLSMERNMKCGVGLCGHCQLGPHFVCKDGPVHTYEQLRPWIVPREV